MPQISLVLFDLDGVLCRYDRAARLADLQRLSGTPAAEIYQAIWQSGFEDEADAGRLDNAAYLRGFGKRLGYPITLDEWLTNRKLSMTPAPDVLALLPRVRVPAAVLTNNHWLVREHLKFLLPELARLCGDNFYVSAQFGARKTQRQAYTACVAAAGGIPGGTLFTDDAAANVDAARQAGLVGHLFTDAKDLAAMLRQHGVL